MKKILLAAATLMTLSTIAWAGCPIGTRYNCTQGFNGKVICGCR